MGPVAILLLWSLLIRIFPSLPGSRLSDFYHDASSTLLQLVSQWLNFTYSRSHAFRYERKNTNPTLVRIELTTSALLLIAGVCTSYPLLIDHSGDEIVIILVIGPISSVQPQRLIIGCETLFTFVGMVKFNHWLTSCKSAELASR